MGKTVAIIPARGGSKGIPGKNIIDVEGRPLIYYTLKRAFESNLIDLVVVSSDDDKILETASMYFPDTILIKRPEYLAEDTSKSIDVILHSLNFIENENDIEVTEIVMLESTSPLRKSGFLDEAINSFRSNKNCTALVGISAVEAQHPAFLCSLNSFHQIRPINGSNENLRRQDIEGRYYFYEGSIYLSDKQELVKNRNFYRDDTMGFVVDKIGSIEVDDQEDLLLVRSLIRYYFENDPID